MGNDNPTPHADALCREIDAQIGPRRIYPISFAIPASLITDAVPAKTQDFATGTSRGRRAYKFDGSQQDAYYADYRNSRLGLTYRKGGWDCMRHLEMMANGCLPYFPGGGDIPRYTMAHYPKDIIVQAMALAGNVRMDRYELVKTDPDRPIVNDNATYDALVAKMLGHLRTHTTTLAMADYLLRQMGQPDAKSVLFIGDAKKVDYISNLLFHGLRERLGAGCVDADKLWWMYDSASPEKRGELYGKGYTYSGHLQDLDCDRTNLRERIKKQSFDLVVFGSATRCCELLPYVRQHYGHDQIALVDGEDYCRLPGWTRSVRPKLGPITRLKMGWRDLPHLGVYFKRELDHAVVIDLATTAPQT